MGITDIIIIQKNKTKIFINMKNYIITEKQLQRIIKEIEEREMIEDEIEVDEVEIDEDETEEN
jgi:hypothetical protein